MQELSQDAIRELGRSLPLLERLLETFTRYHEHEKSPPPDEIWQLQNTYDRVSQLTSPSDVCIYVGGRLYTVQEEPPEEVTRCQKRYDFTSESEMARAIKAHTEKLYLYVKGIVNNEVDRLTQENTSLKEQLAELRKRELDYLSNAKGAIPHSVYASYQRERALLVDNIHFLREQAAMYGPLDTPLRIRNEIEALEKLINEIDAHIARSKASKTDWI